MADTLHVDKVGKKIFTNNDVINSGLPIINATIDSLVKLPRPAINQYRTQQETRIYSAIIIASVIIGVIIILFLISLFRHQRKLLEYHRLNILTEVTTLENERSRIAADLHDELAPLLYLVKYQVSSLDIKEKDDISMLAKSVSGLDTIAERIRGISRDLLPTALTRKGIITALEEYISDLNASSELNVILKYNIQSHIVPAIGVNLFRILQELIQNTLKHAKATDLLIRIKEEKKHLEIICEDNGIGFNYQKHVEANSGLGLQNIKSRIEILKGEVTVVSVNSKGTQFLMKIPLSN